MKLDYTFAIETIPASIASIEVTQVYWPHGEEKQKNVIPMIDCRYAPNTYGAISHQSLSKNRFYDGQPFLCPDTSEMILKGNLESDLYAYIEIDINGCQLPEEECASDEDILNYMLNMYYLTSIVDFTEYVANSAADFDNREKVTIVIDPEIEKKHSLFYTNSTIKFNDNPIRVLSSP